MKWNSPTILLAVLLPWFAIGCASTDLPHQPIQYLAGIGHGMANQRALSPLEAGAYWDGDGVEGSPEIVIDLGDQHAYFYKGETLVGVTPISTGDAQHRTPTGTFRVTEKDEDHRSSRYGDYVDRYGNVVKKDVDNQVDPVRRGRIIWGRTWLISCGSTMGLACTEGFCPAMRLPTAV